MAFGVTLEGFVPKLFEDITASINSTWKSTISNSLKVNNPKSFLSLFRDPFADQAASMWSAIQDVSLAQSLSFAEGFFLDELVKIQGITRLAATKSVAQVDLVGTPLETITAGSIFQVENTDDQFELINDVQLDNGGLGSGFAQALATGPIQALANTLIEIPVSVQFLNSVNNPQDAILGRDLETDEELRARALESFNIAGGGTPEAIRARIRNLTGVQDATVIENVTLVTDPDGRPGKSYEVIIEGGDDQEIGETLWDTKPAGILVVSTSNAPVVVDVFNSQGVLVNPKMTFSRPDPIDIYILYEVYLNPEEEGPLNIVDVIDQVLLDFGNTLRVGQDVIWQRFVGEAQFRVPGISFIDLAIDTAPIGGLPGPQIDIPISGTEIAKFSSLNIAGSVAP